MPQLDLAIRPSHAANVSKLMNLGSRGFTDGQGSPETVVF